MGVGLARRAGGSLCAAAGPYGGGHAHAAPHGSAIGGGAHAYRPAAAAAHCCAAAAHALAYNSSYAAAAHSAAAYAYAHALAAYAHAGAPLYNPDGTRQYLYSGA